MKILFTIQEEKTRGINFILKSLLVASKTANHKTGLLVGYPTRQMAAKSSVLSEKVEHTDLQHYVQEGTESFKNLVKGGLRKRHILSALLQLKVFKTKERTIKQEYLLGQGNIEKQLDYTVNAPYFYQFLARDFSFITRFVIRKIVRKHKIDLVVAISPTSLRSKDAGSAKIAHFVHDIMPLELVESPSAHDTVPRFAKQFETTVENSDLILVNSNDTASKVREVNPKANVHVLYGTASSNGSDIPETSVLQDLELDKNKYFLFASTLEKRKNLSTLLEGFSQAATSIDEKLVLIGATGYGFAELLEQYEALPDNIKDRIVFTGYVSEADKYTLYKNALAFVFPSVYEGIGLVVIEAMVNNLPVLTSRRGALPEAGGDAALYVEDPYDAKELAEKIILLSKDDSLRQSMIKNNKKQIEKFTQDAFNDRFNAAVKSL